MKKPSHQQLPEDGHTTVEKYSLKGTFVTVLILAAIMMIFWFGILVLFLERI